MGADQQFCLRWNNFHSNITSAFESLRDDEDFVDITLACDGRQIKAHKMVLSACSPYFRSLLKGNPCQHPIVFLKDVTFSNLSSILDFMYHGEVNVSHNELATFLKTAEALKVRGLAEDEKKKDSENYNESSSPPPPRDPPDPGSPRPEESSTSAPDAHLSDSPPPKRQRRRSGNSVNSTEDTSETVLSDQQPVRDTSIKDEPHEFNEEEDILGPQNVDQDNLIKSDEDRNFGPTDSVSIRSQAAMQQLQESFGSFLPGMGQSPGFLPHGATDMPRPPPYPLEGVQGLPPGISALPGPSMSQGAASQDASQEIPLSEFKKMRKTTEMKNLLNCPDSELVEAVQTEVFTSTYSKSKQLPSNLLSPIVTICVKQNQLQQTDLLEAGIEIKQELDITETLENDGACGFSTDCHISFEEVSSGTKRGGKKLISSDGYTFTVRKVKGNVTYWNCSVRGRSLRCKATVTQIKDTFKPGPSIHEHPPDPGALHKIKIYAQMKRLVAEQITRSVSDIVREVMQENSDTGLPSVQNEAALVRAGNLHRQKLRMACGKFKYQNARK